MPLKGATTITGVTLKLDICVGMKLERFVLALTQGNDGIYFKSYQNKYYSSNKMDYFSAGNKQDEYFQVSFYDEWRNHINTYKKVWYRDTFFVSKHPHGGSLIIVYARGSFNKEKAGFVDFHEHP